MAVCGDCQTVAAAQAAALLSNLLGDRGPTVSRAAADALGTIGRPESVPILVRALSHPDGGVAENAVRSLIQIGKPAISMLTEALGSPNPTTAYWAAAALSAIPEAEPALLRAAATPTTRKYALIALIKRNSAAAVPLLQQAANTPDPALRELAQRGLQQLAP
jgi:HEAT repeat protein